MQIGKCTTHERHHMTTKEWETTRDRAEESRSSKYDADRREVLSLALVGWRRSGFCSEHDAFHHLVHKLRIRLLQHLPWLSSHHVRLVNAQLNIHFMNHRGWMPQGITIRHYNACLTVITLSPPCFNLLLPYFNQKISSCKLHSTSCLWLIDANGILEIKYIATMSAQLHYIKIPSVEWSTWTL